MISEQWIVDLPFSFTAWNDDEPVRLFFPYHKSQLRDLRKNENLFFGLIEVP